MLNLYFQGVTFLLANRSQKHLQGVTLFFCPNRCPFPRQRSSEETMENILIIEIDLPCRPILGDKKATILR